MPTTVYGRIFCVPCTRIRSPTFTPASAAAFAESAISLVGAGSPALVVEGVEALGHGREGQRRRALGRPHPLAAVVGTTVAERAGRRRSTVQPDAPRSTPGTFAGGGEWHRDRVPPPASTLVRERTLTSTFSPAVATSLSNDFEIVSVRTNVPAISATPSTTASSVNRRAGRALAQAPKARHDHPR